MLDHFKKNLPRSFLGPNPFARALTWVISLAGCLVSSLAIAQSVVSFSPAIVTVSEAAGTAQLTITRSGSSSGAISVNYSTTNGTALSPNDYSATNGTLNWADGETAAKTVLIPVIQNTTLEGTRYFNVFLSGATGGATIATQNGAVGKAIVRITDDEPDTFPTGTGLPAGYQSFPGIGATQHWAVTNEQGFQSGTSFSSGPVLASSFYDCDYTDEGNFENCGIRLHPGVSNLVYRGHFLEGVLGFYVKADSLSPHAKFRLLIDTEPHIVAPGQAEWTYFTVPIARGTRYISWQLYNESTIACSASRPPAEDGQPCSDSLFVDAITFPQSGIRLDIARATGLGHGRVTGPDIDCVIECSQVYPTGTVVNLTAIPAANSIFDGWTGACSGLGVCTVTLDSAKSVGLMFSRISHNINAAITGSGSVTSSPSGIQCPTDCVETLSQGSTITLTATPAIGWVFAGWTGDCTGSTTCTLTIDAAKSVTATFTSTVHNLATSVVGNGSVTSSPSGIQCPTDCSEAYTYGTTVSLTATPAAGMKFVSWSGACTGTGVCMVTMDMAKSVTATFAPIMHTMSIPTIFGIGNVVSSPPGINCPSNCEAQFPVGTVVTLSAVETNPSFRFSAWSACTGTASCVVTMDASKSVTAAFSFVTYTLTVQSTGTGSGSVASAPAGVQCPTDCNESYAGGTVVSLTATANSGSEFSGWSGACTGTGACVVTMDAAKSVTANFALKTYTLSVAKSGTGTGSVASDPAGITCDPSCTSTFTHGTLVTLVPTATASSTFSGWSGACTGTGTCVVMMDVAKSVTANFAVRSYPLNVTKSGAGTGSVTSNPAGVTCDPSCASTFVHGTMVTLVPTAASSSIFSGWSGPCTGAGECVVTMDAAKSVTANFAMKTYTLSVVKSGSGDGSIASNPVGIACDPSCESTFVHGTMVTLVPTAASSSIFSGWSGACTGAGECVVTMDAAKSVTANFALKTYTLSVVNSGSGDGSIASNPAGVTCGTSCESTFVHGTMVTLTPAAAPSSTFSGWSGACTGTGTCVVMMDAAKSVTANFVLKTYPLSVASAGNGNGSITSNPAGIACDTSCTSNFVHGTMVTLVPTATASSTFSGWSGACTGTGTCVVMMDAAKSVTANFALRSYALSVTTVGSGLVASNPAGIACVPTCSTNFVHGTMVTLVPTAAPSSTFSGWSGACTGTGACVVTMDATQSVTANFAVAAHALTISVSNPEVTVVGITGHSEPCTSTCTYYFAPGTVVELSGGSQSPNWLFFAWDGACTGAVPCRVTMDGPKSVTGLVAYIGAPTILSATPIYRTAIIQFSPSEHDPALPISGYTLTCGDTFLIGIMSTSVEIPLVQGQTHSCSIFASTPYGNSPPSASVSVTIPPRLALQGVWSRKNHAGIGDRDIPIDGVVMDIFPPTVTSAISVEPRIGAGGHLIVFRLSDHITHVDAVVVSRGLATYQILNNEIFVKLDGVPDNSRVEMSVIRINGVENVHASIGFLVGDINSSGAVNAADILPIKRRVGSSAVSNFRYDLNLSGSVDQADKSAAQARAGHSLPQ